MSPGDQNRRHTYPLLAPAGSPVGAQRSSFLKEEDITSDAAAANSVKIIPVKSYQDYALHYAAKYFERGIGLYFDNVCQ